VRSLPVEIYAPDGAEGLVFGARIGYSGVVVMIAGRAGPSCPRGCCHRAAGRLIGIARAGPFSEVI
jgi:hypothetical protein